MNEKEKSTEECLNYLESVFSLVLPTPTPPLPYSFINLVPQVNIPKSKINKLPPINEISSELHLSFLERFPALSMIDENKYSIIQTESGKMYTSIFILQSICPPFLENGEYFDIEILRYLIDLLLFSNEIAPQFSSLCNQSFGFLYEKCVKNSLFLSLIPDLTRYFQSIGEYPICWFRSHILILKNILLKMISEPNILILEQATTLITTIAPHFACQEVNWEEQPELLKDLYDSIYQFSQTFLEKNPTFSSNQYYFDLKQSAIKIGLELNRITNIQFKQYSQIVVESIQGKILTDEELNQKAEPISLDESINLFEHALTKSDPNAKKIDLENSPEIPKIESLYNILSSMNHPILKYHEYLFSCLSNYALASLIELIIIEGQNLILSGNYSLQVFIIYELLILKDLDEMANFFKQKNIKSLFFTDILFNPAITIFNNPQSKILSIRASVFELFKKLVNESTVSFYIPILTNYLNKFTPYPEMFSEFLAFSAPILNESNNSAGSQWLILGCISRALRIQYEAKIQNKSFSDQCMFFTFYYLDKFLDSIKDTIDSNTFYHSSFLDDIIFMIFDPVVSDVVFSMIEKYLSMFSYSNDQATFDSMVSKIIPTLDFCFSHIEACNQQCTKLFFLLFNLLCSLSNSQIGFLKNTNFFEKVREFISLKGISADSLAYALVVEHFASEKLSKSEWKQLTEEIESLEMTQKMYEAILILLSHNNEPFTGIANQNAVYLIPSVLKSQFCLHFLNKLYNCLENCIPDQILFSELGLVRHIINILNEETSDEIYHCVLKILLLVFSSSTRRNDLLAFFRLFSPTSPGKQTRFMQSLLSILPKLFTKGQSSFRSIIRFTSQNSLINLPTIPRETIINGFTLSYRIMVSNFQKASDSIMLFNISSANIKCFLYQSKIVISSSIYENDIVFNHKFPINEWFVLDVSFSNHPDSVAVFSKENFVGSSNQNNLEWPAQIENNSMFGNEGQGFVECNFNQAAIFINSGPNYQSPDLVKDESLRNNPYTFFLIDSEISEKNQIQNIAQSSTQKYEYHGQLFQTISKFNTTFYYSNGISFLISLFQQINYDIPSNPSKSIDGDEHAYTNSMYLYQLLELVCVLIQISDPAQQILYEISAFEVIAHFMNDAKKITMNFDASVFLGIQSSIRNQNLLFSFVRSILLNFPLWVSSPVSTLVQLFSQWSYSTKIIPDAFTNELRPLVILNVLMTLHETNRINDKIKEMLFDILIKALTIECQSHDIAMIISVMHICKNDPEEILDYLEMLNQFVIKCPSKIGPISLMLVMTEWISLYPDPLIKSTLIKYFFNNDSIIYIQYILKNIQLASSRNESENDQSLLDFCRTFTGFKCDSIDLINEKLYASSNSFDPNNKYLFPILIGYGLYSSESTCEKFSNLLFTIFSKKEGVELILNDKTKFILFILVAFLLIRSPNKVDFMIQLVSSSPLLLSNALLMIDLFTHICLIEYHQVQTLLLNILIDKIFSPSFKGDVKGYITILTNFVCFHSNELFSNEKANQNKTISFNEILEECKVKKMYLSRYSFILHKVNNEWTDIALVYKILRSIPADKRLESDRILVLLSFLCHPSIFSPNDVLPLLNKFVTIVSPDSKSWIPIIYQSSKHVDDFKNAKEFYHTFKAKLKLTKELYDNFNDYFNEFISSFSFENIFSGDNQDSGNAIRQSLTFESVTQAQTENAIKKLRKSMKNIQYGFESCWDRLRLRILYNNSPFYNSNCTDEDFYRRGNYFDYKLRPLMLVRDVRKSNNPEDDLDNSDLITSESKDDKNSKIIINNYQDNQSEIYECRCYRIHLKKVIPGTFHFKKNSFEFVTDNSKVKRININSITHFFWASSPLDSKSSKGINSIQFFLNNKSCYLFTFPNDEVSKLISKGCIKRVSMSSIKFFQENEPELELDRLQITKKWVNLEISNFDYILWLNILSGRSFLNKDAYPVFPNVFEYNNEKQVMMDYSKLPDLDNSNSTKSMIESCLGSYEPFKSLDSGASESNSTYDQIDFIIPPELYLNELFFVESNDDKSKKGVSVPQWAKTKESFIYQMRKSLESEQVSGQIHKWIDKVFGPKPANNNSSCPVSLFKNPHIHRKQIFEDKSKKIETTLLLSLSQFQILDFSPRGQSRNDTWIFGISSNGKIIKSRLDVDPCTEKIDSIPAVSKVVSSPKYLFFNRFSLFGVYSFDRRKVFLFSSEPLISKVTALAICDDFVAAGGNDGCVVLWNLSINSDSPTKSEVALNSEPTSSPIPLKRRRTLSRSLSNSKKNLAKEQNSPFNSVEVLSTSDTFPQVPIDGDDDFSNKFSSVFDLNNSPTKSASPLNSASSSNSIEKFTSLHTKLLFIHKRSICSLQISSLLGIVLSADLSGTVAISFLPGLQLYRTISIEQSDNLKKAVVTEGYGCIVVLSKPNVDSNQSVSKLSSFSLNGDLLKEMQLDGAVGIVDICGIVGSVTGLDYLIVADSNNYISVYDAFCLDQIKLVYHFDDPIRKIKYSSELGLLSVFFNSRDGIPAKPPALISFVMN